MKKSQELATLFALLAGGANTNLFDRPNKQIVIPQKPKDWNHTHFFNCHGSIRNTKNENTVFSCRALNDKNAIRKFEKWVKTKQ